MYIKNGDTNPITFSDLQHLHPLTSFPVNGPNDEWLVSKGYTRYTPPPATNEQIALEMEAQFDRFLDSKAQEKGFANRHTLAECAGYPGPYHDMAQAFGTWKDTCNAYAAEVKKACLAGTRPQPTMEQLLSELPVLIWPV